VVNNSQCIVSNNQNEDELEACHIIPISKGGTYILDNGLILTRNLHATYDKFKWSINPSTLNIETHKKSGSILSYKTNKVNIKMNPFLYSNLQWHYEQFIKNTQNK
jgi:predicted restriction endonuclease